jgi:hypothetical protein
MLLERNEPKDMHMCHMATTQSRGRRSPPADGFNCVRNCVHSQVYHFKVITGICRQNTGRGEDPLQTFRCVILTRPESKTVASEYGFRVRVLRTRPGMTN